MHQQFYVSIDREQDKQENLSWSSILFDNAGINLHTQFVNIKRINMNRHIYVLRTIHQQATLHLRCCTGTCMHE